LLLIGVDALILLAVTLIGFAVHERSLAGGRWLSTFLPLAVSWAGIALPFGLYKIDITRQPAQIWRVFLAAAYTGPLAGLVRTLWFPGMIIPVFILVLIAMTAAAMGVWRLIFAFLTRKKV
jgi:hypothetical protein